jgi:glyoxylase-like metal-dependent hydrolase (beta-lactamase superfamily II)/rhodanese-related sulfurtransferase
MTVEQIYTGCLAQGAYYVQCGTEAAIIDPLREVAPYIEKANRNGAKIKYVLETHFHADFVSGHIDLARITGAKIIYGPTAQPKFEAHVATDGEELKLGNCIIKVLHTPGHTMESATFLLINEEGKQQAIFTGDTVFLGDVGRPDLAQKAAKMTQQELAGVLYDSIQTKILPLPDDIIIYPGHGAGSACGKNMMKETQDTLGNQKQVNYALRPGLTRDQFIQEVTDGLLPPPAYFPENARMNKEGYTSINEVLKQGTRALTPAEFELIANESEALILDTRAAKDFRQGFIPNSINIGVDGTFAPWAGALIPGVSHPLLIIADAGREEEVVTRLARVGYDHTLGYLKGGFTAWQQSGKAFDTIDQVNAAALTELQKNAKPVIVDVRREAEFVGDRVTGSKNVPLDYLNDHLAEVPKDKPVYVYCAGGYRSMIAISILKARGWNNLVDVEGGMKSLQATSIPRSSGQHKSQLVG